MLAPGKTADIIAVTGNPYTDITMIEQVDLAIVPIDLKKAVSLEPLLF